MAAGALVCGSGNVKLLHAGGRQCHCIAISGLAMCTAVMAARLIL